MKSKIEGLTPQGGGVYEDKKGRLYIGDRKKRTLYVVDRGSKNKLGFYQQRYTLPVIALIIMGFYVNWYVAVPAAALTYGVVEFFYRRFLSGLTVYEDAEIPKNLSVKERLADHSTGKLALLLILSILLGALMMVNLFQTIGDFREAASDPAKMILVVVTIAMDVYALYFAASALSVLMERMKK